MRSFLDNLYANGDAKYEEPKAYDLIIAKITSFHLMKCLMSIR